MDNKMILVTGATGQQGGAVARHLLKNGWQVRALVRDPQKDAAQALAAAGAELVQGDMTDRVSLDAALVGATGVYSVQNFWLPDVGAEGEIRQGKLLADAAAAAGVQHFVYSSVGSADTPYEVVHFASKHRIEQHLAELGLPTTIIRPVYFMENANWSRPAISNGQYQSTGLRPDTSLQLIAVDDIGAVVAEVFANPDEFIGTTIELAGDELTEREMVAALGEVIGRPVELVYPTMPEGFEPDAEMMAMLNFFNEEGYVADLDALRARFPFLHTFADWLRATGWEDMPVLPMPETGAAWGN